ncbi:MAG: hypothetical protein ACRCRW_09445 [Aeromonadaceae bacterium]
MSSPHCSINSTRAIWLPALRLAMLCSLLPSAISQANATAVPDCHAGSDYRKLMSCEPVVMVIRHAEDGGENGQHYLTAPGMNHAKLYVSLFDSYIHDKSHQIAGEEKCICEIDNIITIDPEPNAGNINPSSNPYETIRPLADSIPGVGRAGIQTMDINHVSYGTAYEWYASRRKTLLNTDHKHSTVIAWDKQGLNPSGAEIAEALKSGLDLRNKTPLLPALAKQFSYETPTSHFTPQRNHVYLFARQDPSDGKFAIFKFYLQNYSLDGHQWYSTTFLNDYPSVSKVQAQ